MDHYPKLQDLLGGKSVREVLNRHKKHLQEVRQLVFVGLLVDVHAHHADGDLYVLLRLFVRGLYVQEDVNDLFLAVGRLGVSW